MINTMIGTPLDYGIIITYFIGVLLFGSYFGKYTKTTADFFFGGRRFAWWLVSISCVATVVGSYSFIKYASVGFQFGLSSSMTYLNDWFIMPLFFLGWLPIIYFNRIVSVPEYFNKRFDQRTRVMAVIILMLYMVGYIGINFYTLGVALNALLGVDVFWSSAVVALVCAIYVSAGGQTAVIMTDLVQGVLLLIAGFILFGLGLAAVGGFDSFWNSLPVNHRLPFADFNQPESFNFVGIYWQDAIANSIAFYFMNQGNMMRFLSLKSMHEARKVVIVLVLVLMPLAAIATSNAGWIGSSMVQLGLLSPDIDAKKVFILVSNAITTPGIFGIIMAALTAALMSTVDTLINAVSTVFVNDIWQPYVRKNKEDSYYLRVARIAALLTSALGLALVPVFAQFNSIYVAHGAFVATVTPPMVVAIILGFTWRRFTSAGAFATMLGGSLAMVISLKYPQIIAPIAHGTSPEGGFTYMRALFGLLASGVIGIVVSLLTKPLAAEQTNGLVINYLHAAKVFFKGGEPNENSTGNKLKTELRVTNEKNASISRKMMEKLAVNEGDLIYICDNRWWLGGLRSTQVHLGPAHVGEFVNLPKDKLGTLHENGTVIVEVIL